MKIAIFEYKCRRCGDIGNSSSTGEKYGSVFLFGAITDTTPKPSLGIPPAAMDIHSCKDGGAGISDLIGYSVKE